MPAEPTHKRAIAFVDGQNLFHAAKQAFGYAYPNFDPKALSESICHGRAWKLTQTCFYTGVPSAQDSAHWSQFWSAKLAVMGTRGVRTFSRSLRYRIERVRLPDDSVATKLVGQEKGIDVRIALDMVRMAREGAFDVALLFSQDQDLSEAADEVRAISVSQDRWIKVACAFPVSPTLVNKRGVNGTDWVRFDKALYDACIDPMDYRRPAP